MVEKSMKERMRLLEDTVAKQNRNIQMLKDIYEIQNLMGRQIYLHIAGLDCELPDKVYVQKNPDLTTEVAHWGKFVGTERIRQRQQSRGRGYPPGHMFMHTLTTPVIEVAGDGKTAKGLWISPGFETMKDRQTEKLQAHWAWTKYGCDFLKEDGQWKLWHYHVYRIFMTPFDKPWTEGWELKTGLPSGENYGKPDLPTTYDHPYSTSTSPEYVPAPPEPYETWDDKMAY